jgi:thiamine-monophosphate kinase
MTVDQQIAGIHVPADLDVAVWARRLLAVNLSDLAAMGARPLTALLTLAVPLGFPVRRFLGATVRACRPYGMTLAGGDLARANQAVTTMTLIGTRARGSHWVSRSAGRAGDRLWIGGTVGLSATGQRLVARGARLAANRVSLPAEHRLDSAVAKAARRAVRRHLAPQPQLELGEWLGACRRAAAIDLSDGLAKDLHRLCRASGVGAIIESDSLPISVDVTTLAAIVGESTAQLALEGGEDYALLFALPPRKTPPEDFGARAIGRLTRDRRVWLEDGDARRALEPAGWNHLG